MHLIFYLMRSYKITHWFKLGESYNSSDFEPSLALLFSPWIQIWPGQVLLLCYYLQKHREVLFCATPDALEHFKVIDIVTCVHHQLNRMLFVQIPQIEQPTMLYLFYFKFVARTNTLEKRKGLNVVLWQTMCSNHTFTGIVCWKCILRQAEALKLDSSM